jgi:hypothetical protein
MPKLALTRPTADASADDHVVHRILGEGIIPSVVEQRRHAAVLLGSADCPPVNC